MDITVCATVYVKAESAKQAMRDIRALKGTGLELAGTMISGEAFASPTLPQISLSPAMTVHGLWRNATLDVV